MGMGIGINAQKTNAGELTGKYDAIACSVWFTSTGIVMPKMIKYKAADDTIQVIKNIRVLSMEKKNYCGIPALEYSCRAVDENKVIFFKLLFQQEECKWKIIWQVT